MLVQYNAASMKPTFSKQTREALGVEPSKLPGFAAILVGSTALHQMSNYWHWREKVLVQATPPFDIFQHTNNFFDTAIALSSLGGITHVLDGRISRATALGLIGIGVAFNVAAEAPQTRELVKDVTVSAVSDPYDAAYGSLAAVGIGAYCGAFRRRTAAAEHPTYDVNEAFGPSDLTLVTDPGSVTSRVLTESY